MPPALARSVRSACDAPNGGRSVETFAQGAPDRRRIAVLRSPRGTLELGPRLKLLHNVEWTDDTSDEAGCAWQLVCGLTGERPGPAEMWSQQGSKYLGRIAAATAPDRPAEPRSRAPRRPAERPGARR